MICKILPWGVLLYIACTISCIDPVTGVRDRRPDQAEPFETHGFPFMVEAAQGGYWAVDGDMIYRITPDSTDQEGSIVHFHSRLHAIAGYRPSYFLNDRNNLTVFNRAGMEEMRGDSVNTVIGLTMDWKGLVSVDAAKRCRYMTHDDSAFSIYDVIDGVPVLLCTGTFTFEGADPEVRSVLFTSNGDYSAVAYSSNDQDGVMVRTRLYRGASLLYDTAVFDNASVNQLRIVCLGPDIYMLVQAYEPYYLPGNPSVPAIESYQHSVLRFDTSGTVTPLTSPWFYTPGMYLYPAVYRTDTEAWLCGSYGLMTITPDSVAVTNYRGGTVNAYDVPCFRENGEVLLFDETSQDFLSIRKPLQ
jgi:hypothetical protein